MRLTNDQIYKIYKKGGSFGNTGLPAIRIYNALKKYGLQVVIVQDVYGKLQVYNFIPEMDEFIRIRH
jgi:hypothetical protein